MSTTAETTPTPFEWPSGPASVQVSGDWDGWKEKEDLDKQVDGSFSKKVRDFFLLDDPLSLIPIVLITSIRFRSPQIVNINTSIS